MTPKVVPPPVDVVEQLRELQRRLLELAGDTYWGDRANVARTRRLVPAELRAIDGVLGRLVDQLRRAGQVQP